QTSSANRSLADTLSSQLLEFLISRTRNKSEKIRKLRDKYIAHPSTPQSRSQCPKEISLEEIYQIQGDLSQIVLFLGSLLTNTHRSLQAIHINNRLFDHLDKPWVYDDEQIRQIEEGWSKFRQEMSDRSSWQWEDFLVVCK
ncbi:MAG: hypothetical protein ABH878_05630, partial [bacterium]